MRLLFYGDSNTWGYDAMTGRRLEKRFTRLLMKKLDDEIIEEGLNGRTICFDDPCEPGRNGLKDIRNVLKTHIPIDMVFINLGANDAKRIYSSHEYTIEKGMTALCHQIFSPGLFKNGYTIPKIVLVQPARMHPDYEKNEETKVCFGHIGFKMLNKAGMHLKNVANQMGIDYMPTAGLTAGAYDGIHMDEKGHALLASYIIKKLEEYR